MSEHVYQPRDVNLAFFDLDGTLVVGQTQRLLVTFLREKGMIGLGFLLGTGIWFILYRMGLVKATDRARARAGELFAGMNVQEVDTLMDEFAGEELVPRLHAGALNALRGHREAGDEIVILSAALQPLVDALGRALGVKDCEGTRLERKDGIYTGQVIGRPLYGSEKARVARAYLEGQGADPGGCSAYADHETDVDLLRLVGTPVAVNPRRELQALAEESGWRILP